METPVAQLCDASTSEEHEIIERRERAQRRVKDADAKLARYREALDSGADAVVIGQWNREVRAERQQALDELGTVSPMNTSEDEIRELVE